MFFDCLPMQKNTNGYHSVPTWFKVEFDIFEKILLFEIPQRCFFRKDFCSVFQNWIKFYSAGLILTLSMNILLKAITQRRSVKKLFLNVLQNLLEDTCAGVSF